MKIEVVSERFSYIFNCDKVIDGNREAQNTIDNSGKLVILRKTKHAENAEATSKDTLYETIAVFNVWTFWRIIEDKCDAPKDRICLHCAKPFKDNDGESRFCPACTHANGK